MEASKANDKRDEAETSRKWEETLATLAQEVNQPLAAIRINAQAALRFLDGPNPDLDEVRSALREIVEDDQRAAEGVRRLHALARQSGET